MSAEDAIRFGLVNKAGPVSRARRYGHVDGGADRIEIVLYLKIGKQAFYRQLQRRP